SYIQFLSTNSYLFNVIANHGDQDSDEIAQFVKGMGLDPRIGPAFLQAGLGYGGSCFPKDTDSLVHTAAARGVDFVLLRAAVEINQERASHFVRMIEKALAPLDDKRVAVLGLAFKPNTDDR